LASLIEIGNDRRHRLADETLIGRGDHCQIRIADPLVSPVHAAIVRAGGDTYVVRDLASRRGTYVGSRQVTEAVLRDGDELLIGPVQLRFVVADGDDDDDPVRLRAIVELGRAIGVEHDLERVLVRVLDTCFALLGADRGAIVLYQAPSKTPIMTVTRDRRGPATFAVSSAVLGQVMLSHAPYLRTEIACDEALGRSESLVADGVQSVMAVPIRYQADDTEWLGVIVLDAGLGDVGFQPRDLSLLEAIAGQAGLGIKNAMLVRQLRSVIGEEWQRLERVVRDLPLGVVVLDTDRRCVLVNRWVEVRAAELGAIRPGVEVETIAGVACEVEPGGEHTSEVATPAGSVLGITVGASRDGSETRIVIHDLTTERERASKIAHRDRLELIGQLAGGIAHDFNNLLHVILEYARLLQETVEDSEQREDAGQIIVAATSAAELTRQLLMFSRRDPARPSVVDVGEIVRRMQRLLQRTVGSQIELSVTVGHDLPRILIDAAQIEQIVLNLVVNARDALGTAGRVWVTVDGIDRPDVESAVGRAVRLEVGDDGPGMSADVQARMFEPYFTTKPVGQGTGLGLATVYGIVERAKGQIAVDSAPGRGTRVRIVLPATARGVEAARSAPAPAARRATVLVVDDDDQVRALIERMTRNAGYTVVSARSAADALAVLVERAATIDVVLSDVIMPGMTGRDLARAIEGAHPGLPVLLMSGYHRGPGDLRPVQLNKPFTRTDLLDCLASAVAPATRAR
jgi:signal transduction histidine kinase